MNSRQEEIKKGEETLPEINPNASENKIKKEKSNFPWESLIIVTVTLILGTALLVLGITSMLSENDIIKSLLILCISIFILIIGFIFSGNTFLQYIINRFQKFTTLRET